MKVSTLRPVLATALFLVLLSGGLHKARAEDAPAKPFSFNIAGVSDYRFRGISQTRTDPAIQGGVDFSKDLFYAGVWASNVRFPGDKKTNTEVDLYAGIKPTWGKANFDFGVIYYGYPSQPNGVPAVDYTEVKAAVSYPVGKGTIGANVFYSDKFGGGLGKAWYYEANAAYPLEALPKLTLSGAVGRQTLDKGKDYTTWNLGGTYAITDSVGFDLRYVDTDNHSGGDIYKAAAVASLKLTF